MNEEDKNGVSKDGYIYRDLYEGETIIKNDSFKEIFKAWKAIINYPDHPEKQSKTVLVNKRLKQ